MHKWASVAIPRRVRSGLMVFCALVLFLAGLLLLFAPASPRQQSRLQPRDFPWMGYGWIMGAPLHEQNFMAGG